MLKCCWGIFSHNYSTKKGCGGSCKRFTAQIILIITAGIKKSSLGWRSMLLFLWGETQCARSRNSLVGLKPAHGRDGCSPTIGFMDLHRWALLAGRVQNYQTLVSTGSSRKAIKEACGPLDELCSPVGSFSSKVLKLSFRDLVSAAPNQGKSGIGRKERYRKKKKKLFKDGEESSRNHVNSNSRAPIGTATTEKNRFGSSCCFMAEY